ncbi:MAG: hypothetical protein HC930_12410 [Hydrococcus sp. SU_1_0]|nr:hypothetical protein [Hydrococcus sp. SU_1_0]
MEKAQIVGQNTPGNLDEPTSDSDQENSSASFMKQLSLLFLLLFFCPVGYLLSPVFILSDAVD